VEAIFIIKKATSLFKLNELTRILQKYILK